MPDSAPRPRIASLVSSATEIACALGLGAHLVARSHECDTPEWVRDLPCVTKSRVDPGAPSAEIDRRVKALVAAGEALYEVDAERLRDLKPDLILLQAQCDVCAVSPKDLERSLGKDFPARVVTLSGDSLRGILNDIERVAAAAGVPESGRRLVSDLERRIAAVAGRSAGAPCRPRVVFLEWLDPPMVAGGWVPELVRLGGGEPVLEPEGKYFRRVEWADVEAADPDLLFVCPCGFDLERTRREAEALPRRADRLRLRAVRDGKVALADGNRLFNRPGPGLARSLEVLAAVLHPQLLTAEGRGRDWDWLEPA